MSETTELYSVAKLPGAKMRKIHEVAYGQKRITKDCKARFEVGQIVLKNVAAKTYSRITAVEEVTFGGGDHDVVRQYYTCEDCAAPEKK